MKKKILRDDTKPHAKDCPSRHSGECLCGVFKPTHHTPAQWFLVAASNGVDIRHKFEGQELTLVERCNYQIANKIVRAVNSHERLLKYELAIKHFLKTFEDQIENDKDMNGADTVDQVASLYQQFKALSEVKP